MLSKFSGRFGAVGVHDEGETHYVCLQPQVVGRYVFLGSGCLRQNQRIHLTFCSLVVRQKYVLQNGSRKSPQGCYWLIAEITLISLRQSAPFGTHYVQTKLCCCLTNENVTAGCEGVNSDERICFAGGGGKGKNKKDKSSGSGSAIEAGGGIEEPPPSTSKPEPASIASSSSKSSKSKHRPNSGKHSLLLERLN